MSESESHSTVFTEDYMVTSTEYLVSEVVKLDTVTQALQSKVSTVSLGDHVLDNDEARFDRNCEVSIFLNVKDTALQERLLVHILLVDGFVWCIEKLEPIIIFITLCQEISLYHFTIIVLVVLLLFLFFSWN